MINLEDSSLADIVSNILAVLMLITVMIMLGAGAGMMSRQSGTDADQKSVEFDFLEPDRSPLPAFTSDYIVSATGISALRLERIAEAIDAQSGRHSGEARLVEGADDGVRYKLERFGGSGFAAALNAYEADLTQFKLDLQFQAEPIPATRPWGSVENLADWIVERARTERRAPGFYVTQSGYDRFAALYDALTSRRLCFRWRPIDETLGIRIYRGQDLFGGFDFRRCTLAF